MKTKLILAISAAFFLSNVAMAAQDNDAGGTYQQKTVTTTTTIKHIGGNHETWYKEGGIVPTEYRDNSYVVTHWQTSHLSDPAQGNHWVRGANGDFLLVNDSTGAISSIVSGTH